MMRASLLSAEKRLVAVLPNAIRAVWYADAGAFKFVPNTLGLTVVLFPASHCL